MKRFFTKDKTITLIAALVMILIWEIAARIMQSDLLLPPPEDTLMAVGTLIISKGFLNIIGATILRGLIGFVISFFLALVFGVFAGINRKFHAAIKPLLVTIRSTPVISLILLALIWFQVDQVPVFIALLTMFPIMTTNIIDGIRQVDENLVEMAFIYKVPQKRIIREVYIPATSPYIFSGVSNAMGFGWRAIIIGEVLSQPQYGIGTLMQEAQTYLLVKELIAWTIIAIIISYLFEFSIRKIEQKVLVWK